MRLIDADEAKEKMKDMAAYSTRGCLLYLSDVLHKIDECQTLDAAPVVHAHWVPQHPNNRTGKAYIFVCSNCKKFAIKSRQASIDEMGYVFCPYCGAEMDEE